VVDAVAISPTRLVEVASAASTVIGSSQLRAESPSSASWSARKIESNSPASARRATSW
jgi:hypothetical protein